MTQHFALTLGLLVVLAIGCGNVGDGSTSGTEAGAAGAATGGSGGAGTGGSASGASGDAGSASGTAGDAGSGGSSGTNTHGSAGSAGNGATGGVGGTSPGICSYHHGSPPYYGQDSSGCAETPEDYCMNGAICCSQFCIVPASSTEYQCEPGHDYSSNLDHLECVTPRCVAPERCREGGQFP